MEPSGGNSAFALRTFRTYANMQNLFFGAKAATLPRGPWETLVCGKPKPNTCEGDLLVPEKRKLSAKGRFFFGSGFGCEINVGLTSGKATCFQTEASH